MIQHSHWLVIIEWDGKKPPTRYYNRLHALAIFVSGDKEKSPIQRRHHVAGSAIVAQEGSVLCASESLARTIALLAEECGASYVGIGQVDLTAEIGTKVAATAEDLQTLARVESILGKRGRPTPDEEARWYAVTCLEEVRGYDHHAGIILACPSCGGLAIKYRPGNIATYIYQPGTNLLDWWRKTRFVNGDFEYAHMVTSKTKGSKSIPSDPPFIVNDKERQVADKLINSDTNWIGIVQNFRHLGVERFENIITILDGIFVSRAYVHPDTRLRDRVGAITTILSRYRTVDASRFRLAEREDQYDILDASSRVGVTTLASVILRT